MMLIHDKLLSLIAIICEICALFWYIHTTSLSVIFRYALQLLQFYQLFVYFETRLRPHARSRLRPHLLPARTQSPLHLLPARSHRHSTEGERGRGMELRSCGTAPAASMVSSPQPTPPRTRPRKQGAEKGPALSKRARCRQQRVGSRAAGAGLQPCRFEPDAWTEVAKHLHVTDLWSLSATCRWFRRLLLDDSIWRHAFLRDLSLHAADDPNMLRILHVPRPLHRSWRRLYATALDPTQSYCFRRPEKHIESFRIGGFLMDTSKLLLTVKLALPPMPMLDDCPDTSTGACLLTNVRPGIWIADMHMLRCPVCDHHKCQGTMQVLDARHCELYLENNFTDGTWEYEELGSHSSDGQADTAAAAIFNPDRVDTPGVKNILNAESWIRGRSNLLPRAHLTPFAVALSTNLMPNAGLLSRFQAMQDTGTADGQIVSVRITQQLL